MSRSAAESSVELRVSVTDRCTLRCVYCAPADRSAPPEDRALLTFDEIVRFVRVLASAFSLSKIHLTGGEPLLRPNLPDLVSRLAAGRWGEVALTTNGQLLAEAASDLRRAGLARVNVSVDSLDGGTFAALARGGHLDRTLRGIDEALRTGLDPVKINSVILRGHNDHEVVDLARFAMERGCPIRFLELMPIGQARDFFDDLFVPASEIEARLAAAFRLTPLPGRPGRTSRDFVVTDRAGRCGVVGLIAPESRRFCDGCRRIRLTRTGRILRCLTETDGSDLGPLLREKSAASDRTLLGLIASELAAKRPRRSFRSAPPMLSIGG